MRVVNFGSLNIDYVYRVDHFVQPGETMSALTLQIQCGGTFCRGMVVADLREHPFDAPPLSICVDVDSRRAVEELLTTFME